MYTQVILEVYCSFDKEDSTHAIPAFCKYDVKKPGFHCLENNCKHVGFTYAPNEIAYSDHEGEVPTSDHWLGFGGDMEPEQADEKKLQELKRLWEEICVKKINEAYEEYMTRCGLPKSE